MPQGACRKKFIYFYYLFPCNKIKANSSVQPSFASDVRGAVSQTCQDLKIISVPFSSLCQSVKCPWHTGRHWQPCYPDNFPFGRGTSTWNSNRNIISNRRVKSSQHSRNFLSGQIRGSFVFWGRQVDTFWFCLQLIGKMCITKNLFIDPLGENFQVPIVCYWTTIFGLVSSVSKDCFSPLPYGRFHDGENP